MKRVLLIALVIFAVISTLLVAATWAQTPTTQWVNFYSANTTVAGGPVSVGSVVQAFDPSGVQCGRFTVTTAGKYGFLACYIDDPNTSIDEGVVPGDTVSFTIDDEPAGSFTLPGGLSNGQRFEVNLTAVKQGARLTCLDDNESDNTLAQAQEITGVQAHTFFNPPEGYDQDWAKFSAKEGWVYQIRAQMPNYFLPIDPSLRVYTADGTLIAENDDYFRQDAEVWWWNEGPEQTIYIQAFEAQTVESCHQYMLEVIPWSPGAFQERFGSK